jgi:c-di-GMP-binding flagellar brake protein YcgR
MKEKRLEPRICTAFTVRCTELPDKKNIFYSAIRDLSPGGIQILCEKELPCGMYYNVDINLIHESAEAKAQVAWNGKMPNSDKYYVGLKFLEIKDHNMCKIEDFIDTIYLDTIIYTCNI